MCSILTRAFARRRLRSLKIKKGELVKSDLPVQDLRGDALRAHEFAEQANNFLALYSRRRICREQFKSSCSADGDPRRDLPVEPVR